MLNFRVSTLSAAERFIQQRIRRMVNASGETATYDVHGRAFANTVRIWGRAKLALSVYCVCVCVCVCVVCVRIDVLI